MNWLYSLENAYTQGFISPVSLTVPPIGSLFSDSQTGLILSKWLISMMIPDPKKQYGGVSVCVCVADRFRGIALTSAVCKGFSDVLDERLVTVVEENMI